MIGAFVLIVGISVAAGVSAGGFTMITMIPLGVVLGVLVAFIIFGRRAQRSVYSKAEGQTGAAAWALENLRGKWRVTPGVAATGHFDAVHRVIGRPGVILVAEGSPVRLKPLLAQEKKRTARLVGDIPIYDIVVGNGDGEVPLAKLERHLTRLPANITVKQMDSLESRLSRAGFPGRDGRHAQGPVARHREDARRSADGAPPISPRSNQRRTTAVAVRRSCSPRPSTSTKRAGMTRAIITPRTAARPIPTCCRSSTDATRSPSENWPGVNSNNRTASKPSTNQMTKIADDSSLGEISPNVIPKAARP